MNINRRFSQRLTNLVFFLALSLVLGMLAWLGKQHDRVWDWTYSNRGSLTTETIGLLDRMDRPLRITAYVQDNQALHDRISQVIARYQRHKPEIQLDFSNPDLEPERALAQGVSKAGVLVIDYTDRHETLSSLDERSVALALQRLLRDKEIFVLMSEGHGEASPFDKEGTGLSLWLDALKQAGIHLQPVNLLRGADLAQNTQLLVITTPRNAWLPGEVALIRDYIDKGGNLLWLQDPGPLNGLEPLPHALGIQFVPGTLVDANERIQKMLGIGHPTIIPVLDYGRHPITEGVETQTLFPLAQAIEVLPESEWTAAVLLRSLKHSWSENGPLQAKVHFDLSQGDILGPLDLGLALNRKRGDKEQRVVVIGDSQFANNTYLGYGANRQLLLNLIGWLTEDQGLISLSPRKAPDTRIDLEQTQAIVLAIILLLVLPVMLIVTGLIIWFRRRRR